MDPLALAESADPGSLKRRSVDEDVLAATRWLNEAVTAVVIVPFYRALIHKFLSVCNARLDRCAMPRPVRFIRYFVEASLNVRQAISRQTGLVVRAYLDE